MSFDLPPGIRAALDRLAEGRPRADLARRASALSNAYRSGRGSDTIASADEALAYALVRLPATYAAVAAALAALAEAMPAFSPESLLDAGAGPATASLAAADRYKSLRRATLLDHNRHLRDLALGLLAASECAALGHSDYGLTEAMAGLAACAPADLVLASYLIGELPPDLLPAAADGLWSRTAGALVVVEPGTPAGFARIAALRARLIGAGAHVAAPCPHARPCPIIAPDWCHFSRRLARSRDHRRIKGAELAFEDEKFAYVVLSRVEPPGTYDARVLAPPHVGKAAVTAKLCTAEGAIAADAASRRDRAAYKAHKRWRWGDAIRRKPGTEPAPGSKD